ncbi:MAG: DUF5683 domain-containing protein [Bacteroidales bacterium]
MNKLPYIFVFICTCILFIHGTLYAQIQPGKGFINTAPPGSNLNNDPNKKNEQEGDTVVMSTKPSFTISRYFKALAHKDSMNISQMSLVSMILPGTAQIYNRQAWKLPIIYGSIGGFIGGAVASNISYQRTGDVSKKNMRNVMIAGAALAYWGTVLDGVISFKSRQNPHITEITGKYQSFTLVLQ